MIRPGTKTVAAAVSALLCGMSPAGAATVSIQSGAVMVNQGDGFQPVTADAQLAPGGQIMVQPGGTALITYAGNCTLRVGAGRIWTVQDAPPCADGTTFIDFTARMNNGPDRRQEPPPPPEPEPEPKLDATPLIVGGLIIAGGVGLGIALSHKDKGASP